MFLSSLLPTTKERPGRTQLPVEPRNDKRVLIIEAPAGHDDLPVTLPSKDYHPSKPSPDPVILPGDPLPLFIGDELIPLLAKKGGNKAPKRLLDYIV